MQRSKRITNPRLAATSTVRLIEARRPPEPDQPVNVILKPKDQKKRLPGTKLLIKIAKEREKERARRMVKREVERQAPQVDGDAVDEAMATVMADLQI